MTNKQRQNANRKLADKTLKLVIKRLNKEKSEKRPEPILSIFKTIDYYECPMCHRRLPEILVETAKFNYPCAGRLVRKTESSGNYQCNNFLSDYKPVYKQEADK